MRSFVWDFDIQCQLPSFGGNLCAKPALYAQADVSAAIYLVLVPTCFNLQLSPHSGFNSLGATWQLEAPEAA
jgi:hypothetical protein